MQPHIAKLAPYRQDRSVETMEEAGDFIVGSGNGNPYKDKNLKKNKITNAREADLIAFLNSHAVEDCRIIKPALPQN